MEKQRTIEYTDKVDVSLVKWVGNDSDIINAARVSTMGSDSILGGESTGLISYLMRNRHGSPFEHGMMTFLVRAPIFVWREHHRHRVGFSYNEESARYRELDPCFYKPEKAREQIGKPGHYNIVDTNSLAQNAVMTGALKRANETAWRAYQDMLSVGIAREVARMALPVNIMSNCFVTCNPRSLMHFLSLRVDDPRAQYVSKPQHEIQMVAEQYEAHFARLYPLTYKAFIEFGRVAP